ncbi:MAG: tetratricopeptide repeat protein [Acidobacteria bacterium]|nr:tetratricopeptide repeat protein [Acidobacteriota bacterium]
MKSLSGSEFLTGLVMLVACGSVCAQARRAPSAAPRIDVEDYVTQVTLNPDAHELSATTTVRFKPLEETAVVVFELSENVSVQKILDPNGIEVEFGQDEAGPGLLAVRFRRPLEAGQSLTIKVESTGGFDRDRFSRLYTRDESSAYIGPETTYLLYSSKWFPLHGFLSDRASARIEVNVPLGLTVIGPGSQLPVVTRGITETFSWTASQPILPNSIVAGQYFEKKVQAGAFTIDCFASEKKLASIERSAQALGQILDFYQKTFGVPASGNNMRLVEVDDRLGRHSGFLETIFVTSRELEQERPAIGPLSRRAAYQWWGETVGVASAEDLWLEDGLAYYSSALYAAESGGAEGFRTEMDNLAVLGLKFESKSAVRGAIGLGYRSEAYESIVAGKGAWIVHMLRSVMGDQPFARLLKKYLDDFRGQGGATTRAFQRLAEELYGKELSWFFGQWLDSIGVPNLQTDYVIYKTPAGFRVAGTVKQDRDLFRMPLDIEVTTTDKPETTTIELSGKSTSYDVATFSAPRQVVIDPKFKILRDSKELQLAVQLSLGADLKDRGQYVEAIRAYEAALKINPRKSLVHFRLAEVFFEQFNLQSAANSFRDALNGDRDPKWIEVWSYIYLGKIYDILGQRQRAMAEYNKALNTKDDTFGAQEEAKKWLAGPFTRERTVMDGEKDTKPQQ